MPESVVYNPLTGNLGWRGLRLLVGGKPVEDVQVVPVSVPRLGAPLVLVPGLAGFDYLRLLRLRLSAYFWSLPRRLRTPGNRVTVARLGYGGIAERARDLKAVLDRTYPNEPVHLFAHSSGGLDARYLIRHLGMAGRVLSLTTLGTPHRGSSLAAWAVRRWRHFVSLLGRFGYPRRALGELTPASCRAFNAQTPDVPGVRYYSVAARYEPDLLSPGWVNLYLHLSKEGPNDGMVTVDSASYGERLDVWDGDHVSLANWPYPISSSRRKDRLPQYAAVLRHLASQGL